MKPDCQHWSPGPTPLCGNCAKGKYQTPSFGVCLSVCDEYTGNAIERATLRDQYIKSLPIVTAPPAVVQQATPEIVAPQKIGCTPCEKAARDAAAAQALKDIAVIGHPGRVGGADTELDHQIRAWIAMGKTVHICPTWPPDENAKALKLEERGCIYHAANDWKSIAGMHAISFCNGDFLSALPDIKKHVKTTTFVNCMTWNFPLEIQRQNEGLIDFHLYQTKHQIDKVSPALKQGKHPYRPIMFTPYFHADDFPLIDPESRTKDNFTFGRISRPDADKWGARQLWIYEAMVAPVLKKGICLGWRSDLVGKCGAVPGYISALEACAITQQEFYKSVSSVIMTTDTYENLPRVGMEAMASGSLLVVDKRGGWTEQVEHGKTGWLCENDREFVYYASRVAHERQEADAMRVAARKRMEATWGMEASQKSWMNVFKKWVGI